MTQSYSMAYLTANNLPPLEAISLASDLGFDKISFRLLPAGPGDTPPPLMTDDGLFNAVAQSLRDNEIAMSDAEMIRLNEDTNLDRFCPFLEKCQSLGAKHILVAGDDLDRARITDTYARLCALTWEYGLTADLEFMPWTAIKNIQDARDLVEAAAHPAAAILFDCLHFDRSDSTLEEISAIPADMVNYVQICDGPIPFDPAGDAMMTLGRTARLIPGTGGIDLPAIIARLPKGVPISVEVPNVALVGEIGVRDLVRRSLEETQRLITE